MKAQTCGEMFVLVMSFLWVVLWLALLGLASGPTCNKELPALRARVDGCVRNSRRGTGKQLWAVKLSNSNCYIQRAP